MGSTPAASALSVRARGGDANSSGSATTGRKNTASRRRPTAIPSSSPATAAARAAWTSLASVRPASSAASIRSKAASSRSSAAMCGHAAIA